MKLPNRSLAREDLESTNCGQLASSDARGLPSQRYVLFSVATSYVHLIYYYSYYYFFLVASLRPLLDCCRHTRRRPRHSFDFFFPDNARGASHYPYLSHTRTRILNHIAGDTTVSRTFIFIPKP